MAAYGQVEGYLRQQAAQGQPQEIPPAVVGPVPPLGHLKGEDGEGQPPHAPHPEGLGEKQIAYVVRQHGSHGQELQVKRAEVKPVFSHGLSSYPLPAAPGSRGGPGLLGQDVCLRVEGLRDGVRPQVQGVVGMPGLGAAAAGDPLGAVFPAQRDHILQTGPEVVPFFDDGAPGGPHHRPGIQGQGIGKGPACSPGAAPGCRSSPCRPATWPAGRRH